MTLNEMIIRSEVNAIRLKIEYTVAQFIMDHNNIEYDSLRDYGMLPIEYRVKLENDFNKNFEVCVDTTMDLNGYVDKYEINIRRKKKMTLAELVIELRKIFKFKYLTVRPNFGAEGDDYIGDTVELWDEKPCFENWSGVWFCKNGDRDIWPKVAFLVNELQFNVEYDALHMDLEHMEETQDFSPYADLIEEVDE